MTLWQYIVLMVEFRGSVFLWATLVHELSVSCEDLPVFSSVIPEFSLDTDSLLRFSLQGGSGSSLHTSIQLLLRTRSAWGTLVAVGSRVAGHSLILEVSQSQLKVFGAASFLTFSFVSSLQLSKGHLAVRVGLGSGAHRLQLPGHRLDVGQWVQVGFYRYGNLFVLRLEQGGGDREVQAWLGGKTQLLLDPDGVSVGGGPEWDWYHEQDRNENWEKEQDKKQDQDLNQNQDFQGKLDLEAPDLLMWFHLWPVTAAPLAGCLRDVRVDGHPMPLDGRSLERVVVLERRGVTAGCSSEACRAKPCPIPLRCVDLWRKHQCRSAAAELVWILGSHLRLTCLSLPLSLSFTLATSLPFYHLLIPTFFLFCSTSSSPSSSSHCSFFLIFLFLFLYLHLLLTFLLLVFSNLLLPPLPAPPFFTPSPPSLLILPLYLLFFSYLSSSVL